MNSEDFVWPLRVYYEDTDVSGVVYHANYLKFFERARTEWLRALGYSQETLRNETGLAFTISHAEVAFRVPARLDDELLATVVITEVRRASLTLAQELRYRAGNDRVLATAQVRIACVDVTNFRPCGLPEGFRAKIAMEAKPI